MRQVYRAKPSTTRLPRKSPIKAFLSPNPLLVASFSFDIKQELFIASSYDTYTQAPKLRSLRDLTLQKLQNCLISRYSWYSRYSRPVPGLPWSVPVCPNKFYNLSFSSYCYVPLLNKIAIVTKSKNNHICIIQWLKDELKCGLVCGCVHFLNYEFLSHF